MSEAGGGSSVYGKKPYYLLHLRCQVNLEVEPDLDNVTAQVARSTSGDSVFMRATMVEEEFILGGEAWVNTASFLRILRRIVDR